MSSEIILEFSVVREKLCEYAMTAGAKRQLAELTPYLGLREAELHVQETTEGRLILDSFGSPPLTAMQEMDKLLVLAEKGSQLSAGQLAAVGRFLMACRRMKLYLKKAEILNTVLASYGGALDDLPDLREELERCIRGEQVDSEASPELKRIRRKIEVTENQVQAKLETILRGKKDYFSDNFISKRQGHYVLPVKKEYRHQVSGMVIDTSSTGATVFIEPTAVAKLRDEVTALEVAEHNEEQRILYLLTGLVEDCLSVIRLDMEGMETLDFVFAKAKLSADWRCVPASFNTEGYLRIEAGRHPLLARESCVPLDFSLGQGIKGMVITGPNTGGKTVALKTVGLFCLMAQSGLHLPCDNASIALTDQVLCDIGDGQNISENLSTFSAHITGIIRILSHLTPDSLVLLDELGSGTDPAEGMGIATAVLAELQKSGCLFLATTHYPEIKDYAAKTPGLTNARMAFDRESLRPLYTLEIGEAGESCALYIAKRLGLPRHMLEMAYQAAYGTAAQPKMARTDPAVLQAAEEHHFSPARSSLRREEASKPVSAHALKFRRGDCVMVYPGKQIGIVYQTADEKGQIGVQIQRKKQLVNHKRLQLKAPAEQMYPEDYDFSIVFDSVDTRKKRRQMEKRHDPTVQITVEE